MGTFRDVCSADTRQCRKRLTAAHTGAEYLAGNNFAAINTANSLKRKSATTRFFIPFFIKHSIKAGNIDWK